MIRTPRLPGPRPGFTLVELLVAMALIVLVMAILSAAFQVGMDSLSELKSIGDLNEQLRTAGTTLQEDLRANHLEDATGSPVRLSDPRMHPLATQPSPAWTSP